MFVLEGMCRSCTFFSFFKDFLDFFRLKGFLDICFFSFV